MQRIDLRKELKHLYSASVKEVVEVDVPTFRFLMIDGQGDPNTSSEYAQAVEALFSVSYATKFKVKTSSSSATTQLCPLKGCGGLMTCRRSSPEIGRAGSGR